MNRIMYIIPVFAAFLVMPVHAQLGSQTIYRINFNETNLTQADISAAETTFSSPGILPDNPFYFLKRFGEGVRLMFAGSGEKTKLHLEFAKNRLAEASALLKENKVNRALETLHDYNQELTSVPSLPAANSSTVLRQSTIVLSDVFNEVPEQAKPAIEHALNNTIEKDVRLELTKENSTDTESEIQNEVRHEIERNKEMRHYIKNLENKTTSEHTACVQVVTSAVSPEGECKTFSTPCKVPEGWQKVEQCTSAIHATTLPAATQDA